MRGAIMKRNSLSMLAATAACLGFVLPPTAFAATPMPPQQQPPAPAAQPLLRTSDIALRNGGLLVGQVVNEQGVPLSNTIVAVRYGDREIVRTTTDKNGVFAAQGLRGGQYQLLTEKGQSVCRFWAPDTAPPSAQQ